MPSQSPRAATQGPASQRKRPGDLTGVRNQKLAEERDQAQEEALAAAAAAKAEDRQIALNTVVDYTGSPNAHRVEATEPELHPDTMRIRVNYPIEEMTWGREVLSPPEFDERGALVKAAALGGLRTYAFEEGKQYDVPWELGEHLKSLGYVYDF